MTSKKIGSGIRVAAAAAGVLGTTFAATSFLPAQNPLVTGKQITLPPVGSTQNVGSLPMNLVLTPNGKYAISTDMGFRQSLWAIDVKTGKGVSHIDFNTPSAASPANGLYYGLAIRDNNDGTSTVFASQGGNSSIAVIDISATGVLKQTGTIAMHNRPGDFPAGLALDGRGFLYVAVNEYYNGASVGDLIDPGSLAVIDTTTGIEVGRYNFAIPKGPITPTNYPYSVAALKNGSKVYVTSKRDGQVWVISAKNPSAPTAIRMIQTGEHPDSLLLNKDQSRLYVANASSDTVSFVSTKTDAVVNTALLRPATMHGIAGVTPTNLALSPDQTVLYAALGDMNAVGVVDTGSATLQGYIPTGWYPAGVVATNDGILVANAKGTKTRYPNPGYVQWSFAGQYGLNLIEGNVEKIAMPSLEQLQTYTDQVIANNRINETDAYPYNPIRSIGVDSGKIQHVIYIVKENRTYDQVLGDLKQGNGSPSLALFGAGITPNFHALASRFVLLDNFYDCGEASGDGWPWSTSSIANEDVIKNLPYNYSGRGRNYDFEGQNNGYPAGGFPAKDPDGKPLSPAFPNGLPAIKDIAEGPAGHIWDIVEAAKLPYRNYGFFYTFGVPGAIPDNYPAATGLLPTGHDRAGRSDYDFRRFDGDYADSDAPANLFASTGNSKALYPTTTYGKHAAPSRFSEWNIEFQQMLKTDPTGAKVPAFMTVRFMNDHTVGFSAGAHTPRSMVADNDYAVGQLVEAVSKSPIWEHTAIFVVEDDSQDGPDHVDSHRSTCYVISPYIQKNAVDHTFYNTDSVLKSMELLLGVKPLSQYDAVATPILAWSNTPDNNAPFTAVAESPSVIAELNPTLAQLKPGTEAHRLALAAAKMDFKHPDSANPRLLNEMLWKSVKGMTSKMPQPRRNYEVPKNSEKTAKAVDND